MGERKREREEEKERETDRQTETEAERERETETGTQRKREKDTGFLDFFFSLGYDGYNFVLGQGSLGSSSNCSVVNYLPSQKHMRQVCFMRRSVDIQSGIPAILEDKVRR